jgi:hypothetical protein
LVAPIVATATVVTIVLVMAIPIGLAATGCLFVAAEKATELAVEIAPELI